MAANGGLVSGDLASHQNDGWPSYQNESDGTGHAKTLKLDTATLRRAASIVWNRCDIRDRHNLDAEGIQRPH